MPGRTSGRKKVLYLMHVPWSWIRQRPHFLAEGLSENWDLTVYHTGDQKEKLGTGSSWIKGYPRLLSSKGKLAEQFNYYFRLIYFYLIARQYDVVWITFPNQYNYFKRMKSGKAIIVYDCMDDAIEFYKDEKRNQQLRVLENAMLRRASIVLSSAESLRSTLEERYSGIDQSKIYTVNNGIKDLDKIEKNNLPEELESYFRSEKSFINVAYIGTISSWLDTNSLIHCLEHIESLKILLIGPLDTELPNHDRLLHIDPVDHQFVFPLMEKCDALIMPFILNRLVLGVNPVKAYEYIYSGKPVILRSYPETQQFAEYTYLYDTAEELRIHLDRLSRGELTPRADNSECLEFAAKNTWSGRVKKINSILADSVT